MRIERLSKSEIKKTCSPGLYPDGNGLYLQVTKRGTKSWALLYRYRKSRCKMGLGPLRLVDLAEARKRQGAAHKLLLDDIDPKRWLGQRSMPCQVYRNPALVETIVGALARFSVRYASWPADSVRQRMEDRARARLAEGVEIIHLLWALRPRPVPDRKRILVEALNSEDFITLPKIGGPVRTIRVRYDQRTNDESVDLYTDSGIVPSNGYLLRLLSPSSDPESALINFLTVNPDATREEALAAVQDRFPDFTPYAFEHLWAHARKAAGLSPKAGPGRKPKKY